MDIQQHILDEIEILKARTSYGSTGPSWDSINSLRDQVETLTAELKTLRAAVAKLPTGDKFKSSLDSLAAKATSADRHNAEILLDAVSTTILKESDAVRADIRKELMATASASAASAREARDIAANELESAISTLKSFSYHFANARS